MHRLLRECLIYSSLINKKQSLFVSVGSRGAGRNAVLLKNLKEATQYNRELKPQMKGKILCHSVSSKWTWCNRSTQNNKCIDSYAFIFASMTHLYEKSCEQILFFLYQYWQFKLRHFSWDLLSWLRRHPAAYAACKGGHAITFSKTARHNDQFVPLF